MGRVAGVTGMIGCSRCYSGWQTVRKLKGVEEYMFSKLSVSYSYIQRAQCTWLVRQREMPGGCVLS